MFLLAKVDILCYNYGQAIANVAKLLVHTQKAMIYIAASPRYDFYKFRKWNREGVKRIWLKLFSRVNILAKSAPLGVGEINSTRKKKQGRN